MAVIEIKENNATLTKKNDEVVITKDDGDITINNSTNKGKDILSFDKNDYSKGSFSTAKSGRDLVLTYTESDESIYTQNITIKNYFSKDGRSTSSSIYGYKLGETETKLTDLYINEINKPSYKKNTINGTMFNDLIIGTDNSDKIYTGKGDDIITAGKGNDTINITGSGKKLSTSQTVPVMIQSLLIEVTILLTLQITVIKKFVLVTVTGMTQYMVSLIAQKPIFHL